MCQVERVVQLDTIQRVKLNGTEGVVSSYAKMKVLQQRSEVAEELLRLAEVDVDDLGDEVRGGLVLELLELQELLVQNALVEENGEQTVHVGSQLLHTQPQHPHG